MTQLLIVCLPHTFQRKGDAYLPQLEGVKDIFYAGCDDFACDYQFVV